MTLIVIDMSEVWRQRRQSGGDKARIILERGDGGTCATAFWFLPSNVYAAKCSQSYEEVQKAENKTLPERH